MYRRVNMIKLVFDSFKTLDASTLYKEFEHGETKRIWDRFELVFTPKHDSLLNVAIIDLHVLNGQYLNRHI